MFYVIEGIDGAGCETQGKNLKEKLERSFGSAQDDQKKLQSVFLVKYPDYERNVGKLIKDFLYQNKNLNAEQQFLLYSLQFLMDKEMIAEKRKDGILIADRYFTTTLCYQTLEGIRLEKALSFAEDFGIEKPDLVFYIKVDPDVAIKRKRQEQKEKNRREKDFDFIRKTHKQYQMLVEKQVWTRWVEINGERSIDEITKDIYNRL